MRLLRINDIDVDIDEQTAIGVNYQSYDVKQPGKRFITVSNTFTIPLTSHNSAIFGNAENVQSLSTKIYEESLCSYWVNNQLLIDNAKCRVEQTQERISIFIFQKDDVWDELKRANWTDAVFDIIDWLKTTKGLPSVASPFVGPSSDFITTYANNTEGVFLPMYFGNLLNYSTPLEDENQIVISYSENFFSTSQGGHFCLYAKTIFEYIEFTYGVNFLTSGGVLPGNIWDDPIASSIYVPARNINIVLTGSIAASTIYFQGFMPLFDTFSPLEDVQDKADKTLYDFVNSFMQHFNVLKDEVEVNGSNVIRLARFDDLELTAGVEDWSGGLSGLPLSKPTIEGYAQENIIKFKEIFPEGNTLINSKTLDSLNVNLNVKNDLFEIDAYIPSTIAINGGVALDLSIEESFKTFEFLISDGLTDDDIIVFIKTDTIPLSVMALIKLQKAAIYSLDSEYNFLDEIITYPKYYEVNKWLTQSDLKNFEFFRQYWIRELNGSFFVNKISGFNPDKALEATKLELIRLGDRTPITPPSLDYWMDGVEDPFIDGEGDYWI